MKLFIVYQVDLDSSCLKKSDFEILGVFDSHKKASLVCKQQSKQQSSKTYYEDERCHYTQIQEVELNEEPHVDVRCSNEWCGELEGQLKFRRGKCNTCWKFDFKNW